MNPNLNKESLLAVYVSKGMNKKVNYYSFPLIKKEKWLQGAKTKYDIPQYIEGIPEGFAIFCTTKEAGKVRKYQERIERKNKLKEIHETKKIVKNNDVNREVEDMDVINKRIIVGAINNMEKKDETNNENNMEIEKEEEEDIEENNSINDELQEPLPREDHRYCYICKTKFEKYLKHIRSHTHFDNLYRHKGLFSRIRKSFEKIINFWEINGRKRKIKKHDVNKKIMLNGKKTEEMLKKEGNYQNKKFNVINNIISNIDLNKNHKFKNEKFISDKNDVHPIFNRIILNKNGNNEHIINLTINKNINENIIINNTINNNHSIKTINYINISNKDEEKTIKTFNDKKIHIYKEEKSQPRFVTQCFPKFSTLQMPSLSKPKKRKKTDIFKGGGDIFVISTPKKIDFDYFPMLKIESPKKLINKSILFFK